MTDKHEPASAVATHRITREQAETLYPCRGVKYFTFEHFIAALAQCGITVEEQP